MTDEERAARTREYNRRYYAKHRAKLIADAQAQYALIRSDPTLYGEWLARNRRAHAKRMTKPDFVKRKREAGRRTDVKRDRLKRNADQVRRRNENPALAALTRERNSRWQKDHPDAVRRRRHKRRARKKNAEGSFSSADIAAILTAQKSKCFW